MPAVWLGLSVFRRTPRRQRLGAPDGRPQPHAYMAPTKFPEEPFSPPIASGARERHPSGACGSGRWLSWWRSTRLSAWQRRWSVNFPSKDSRTPILPLGHGDRPQSMSCIPFCIPFCIHGPPPPLNMLASQLITTPSPSNFPPPLKPSRDIVTSKKRNP